MWEWNSGTIYHHGIKGQKWGIRRTKEELARDPNSVWHRTTNVLRKNSFKTSTGVEIKSISKHAAMRAATRPNSPVVTPVQIKSALQKPLSVSKIKYDELGRPSETYYGRKATVDVNPETGNIASVNHTSSKLVKRLLRKGKTQ